MDERKPVRVLLIDDDADLLRVLQAGIELQGYEVILAYDGSEGLQLLVEQQPDLVILDVAMPGITGWEVCRRLRQISDVPLIFLTGKSGDGDVINGLNCGADDYICKPFSLAELYARIEVVLRRSGIGHGEYTLFDDGILHIDLREGVVALNGRRIALSPYEYRLLALLVRRRGVVVSHRELLREVWGAGYENETCYLTLYVHYLRLKLEPEPAHPVYIRTRQREGYLFAAESNSGQAQRQ